MLSNGAESMNDFRLPKHEKRAESPCALQSEAQHGRRSTASIALGVILPLVILSANVWPAAAQANGDGGDVPSAAAEEGDESGVPDPFSDKWKFMAGAGVVNGARYPGSRDNFTRGLPVVSISYGRYFFGAVPGGST